MSQKKILTKSYKEFELLSVNEIPDCDALYIAPVANYNANEQALIQN